MENSKGKLVVIYVYMWQCTYNCSGGTVAQLSHLEDENGTKSCWHLVASSSKQPAERIEVPALIFLNPERLSFSYDFFFKVVTK